MGNQWKIFEKMTKSLNHVLFWSPKWPGNWASEAAFQHTSKNNSNWHVNQGWCGTSGKFLRKWPKTWIWIILGSNVAQKLDPWGPYSAHIWNYLQTFLWHAMQRLMNDNLQSATQITHDFFKFIAENWVNSLRKSATYRRQWTGSPLLQIMTCCLFSAKPLYNQCCLVLNSKLRNKLQWHFNQNSYIFLQENVFENVICKMEVILSQHQCVNGIKRNVVSMGN